MEKEKKKCVSSVLYGTEPDINKLMLRKGKNPDLATFSLTDFPQEALFPDVFVCSSWPSFYIRYPPYH